MRGGAKLQSHFFKCFTSEKHSATWFFFGGQIGGQGAHAGLAFPSSGYLCTVKLVKKWVQAPAGCQNLLRF